jgi:antitoxin ParD1/3/4
MGELTVKIAPPLADYIEELVAEGRYGSAEEAISDALMRLGDDFAETPEQTAALKRRAQQALSEIASGELLDWDPDAIMRDVDRHLAKK